MSPICNRKPSTLSPCPLFYRNHFFLALLISQHQMNNVTDFRYILYRTCPGASPVRCYCCRWNAFCPLSFSFLDAFHKTHRLPSKATQQETTTTARYGEMLLLPSSRTHFQHNTYVFSTTRSPFRLLLRKIKHQMSGVKGTAILTADWFVFGDVASRSHFLKNPFFGMTHTHVIFSVVPKYVCV